PYSELAEDWQEQDFAALDPAWLRLSGRDVEVKHQRAYLQRPRGHSKTSDIGLSCLWVLCFSPRPLSGLAAAADRDQAGLLLGCIKRLVDLNEWMRPLIQLTNYRAVNEKTGSSLDVISADVASSWGHKPDYLVLDELPVWSKPDLWHSLFSAAAK